MCEKPERPGQVTRKMAAAQQQGNNGGTSPIKKMGRQRHGDDDGGNPPFRVFLSFRFVVLSVALASTFAFGVGQICRYCLQQQLVAHGGGAGGFNQQTSLEAPQQQHHNQMDGSSSSSNSRGSQYNSLPQPVLPAGKRMPSSVYTSKQLNTGIPTSSGSFLLARPSSLLEGLGGLGDPELVRSVEIAPSGSPTSHHGHDEEEEEEEIHEPKGQHVLVDIENVDGAFLNSEERLAQALMELVTESGLTMLSYHCHSLDPMGVSCVAVLLESHVSFHTWPIPGVITLDVFTCGSRPLQPLVKFVEKLFGIPRQPLRGEDESSVEPPNVNWIYKNRGFERGGSSTASNPEAVEIRQYLLGWMEYDLKEEVASIETDFQQIDVFDVINPRFRSIESYKRSLTDDGSYESLHPELYRPDRIVYLDGIMQSRRYGEAAYHESLVHPALFAHANPRRVAIIGGGEGATLREALKHRSVEKVTMVEIDGMMVNASRTYLPDWSDCSNLEGSTAPSCFDDPRAELLVADAIGWFIEKFGTGVAIDDEDRYDIIIMDALDPSSIVAFSDVLYNNDDLIGALSRALTDKGILISQVGESEFLADPAKEYSLGGVVEESFIPKLQQHGFEKVKDYEDFHGGFMGVWSYMIAFKDKKSSENWYANEAQIDLEVRERIFPTTSGESSLRYFDGATMLSLSYPSRAAEEVFCRKDVKAPFCADGHGYDPERYNAPVTAFEVKASGASDGADRGVFSKQDVPQGSYVAIDEAVHSMLVTPYTRRLTKDVEAVHDKWKTFDSYVFGHGMATSFFGDPAYVVDPGIMTFINHGCNGTNNVGGDYPVTEMTANSEFLPPILRESPLDSYVHHPYIDRNYQRLFYCPYVNKDVFVGDELLGNYLASLCEDNWEVGVLSSRAACLKPGPVAVAARDAERDDR